MDVALAMPCVLLRCSMSCASCLHVHSEICRFANAYCKNTRILTFGIGSFCNWFFLKVRDTTEEAERSMAEQHRWRACNHRLRHATSGPCLIMSICCAFVQMLAQIGRGFSDVVVYKEKIFSQMMQVRLHTCVHLPMSHSFTRCIPSCALSMDVCRVMHMCPSLVM